MCGMIVCNACLFALDIRGFSLHRESFVFQLFSRPTYQPKIPAVIEKVVFSPLLEAFLGVQRSSPAAWSCNVCPEFSKYQENPLYYILRTM